MRRGKSLHIQDQKIKIVCYMLSCSPYHQYYNNNIEFLFNLKILRISMTFRLKNVQNNVAYKSRFVRREI